MKDTPSLLSGWYSKVLELNDLTICKNFLKFHLCYPWCTEPPVLCSVGTQSKTHCEETSATWLYSSLDFYA